MQGDKENFDHWCHTLEKVKRFKSHILNNLVKAGLVKQPEAGRTVA